MKSLLLQFITAKCEDQSIIKDNRHCTYLDIYDFNRENGITNEQCEELLKELYNEGKIKFGQLINGYYITKSK